MAAPAAVNPSGRPGGTNTCDQSQGTHQENIQSVHTRRADASERLELGCEPATAEVRLASTLSRHQTSVKIAGRYSSLLTIKSTDELIMSLLGNVNK